jgi:hypothetical protein
MVEINNRYQVEVETGTVCDELPRLVWLVVGKPTEITRVGKQEPDLTMIMVTRWWHRRDAMTLRKQKSLESALVRSPDISQSAVVTPRQVLRGRQFHPGKNYSILKSCLADAKQFFSWDCGKFPFSIGTTVFYLQPGMSWPWVFIVKNWFQLCKGHGDLIRSPPEPDLVTSKTGGIPMPVGALLTDSPHSLTSLQCDTVFVLWVGIMLLVIFTKARPCPSESIVAGMLDEQ